MMMMEWNGEEMELINLLYEIFVNTKQICIKGNHPEMDHHFDSISYDDSRVNSFICWFGGFALYESCVT